MLVGADRVVECPRCTSLQRVATVRSGNTFGMRTWTDGRRRAPMLPELPAIAECPRCQRCFFLDQARWSSETDGDADHTLPYVAEPSESSFYEAIATGLARTRSEDKLLRLNAWRRSNDAFRDGFPADTEKPGAAAAQDRNGNLEALLTLMDDHHETDLVLKAEILRELGRWRDAEHVLTRIPSAEHAAIVKQLRELCARHNSDVQECAPERRRQIVIRL